MQAGTHFTKSRQSRETFWLAGGLLILGLAWFGSMITLRNADAAKPEDWDKATLLYLPSGQLLKPMALDFDEALAALIWVRGIQYFADSYVEKTGDEWMTHILEIVTTLNPKFFPAYELGGTVLAQKESEWPSMRKLLQRGIREFPNDWRLPVYLSMGYAKRDSNYFEAANVLKDLALKPGVPDHIRTLSATFLEKGGAERMALAFLVDRYLNAPDALNRDIFLERIFKLFPYAIGLERDKSKIRKLLEVAKMDSDSEPRVRGILYDYLRGAMSPESRRVMEKLI
jgi:hypothetical protein